MTPQFGTMLLDTSLLVILFFGFDYGLEQKFFDVIQTNKEVISSEPFLLKKF